MDDAPIRIFLLCDADECFCNESLKESRRKSSIYEFEREYENWINLFGKTSEISQEGSLDELNMDQGCPNSITAYVDRDQMWFLPSGIS